MSERMLESFQKKVEKIADEYADLLSKNINDALNEKILTNERMNDIYEGIRMLNHVSCTLERIARIQHGNVGGNTDN